MSDFATDLNTLREAAHQRDWGVAQNALTRLLMALEFFSALEIAVTRAYNHLPTFEAAGVETGWARGLLVWITSYGAAPAELPPAAYHPPAAPGAANYASALFELARAMERMTPLENRLRFLANAISNVILAELAAAWYGDHPDAWDEQQARGDDIDPTTGQTLRAGIYAQFWLDPATAARDTAAWLEVADAVEKKHG